MQVVFTEPRLPTSGTLTVGVFEELELAATAERVDRRAGGALRRAMAAASFTGKRGDILDVFSPTNLKLDRIVLVGLGKAEDLDALAVEATGGRLFAHLSQAEGAVAIAIDSVKGRKLTSVAAAAHAAVGAQLRAYRFHKYRTKARKPEQPKLKRLTVMVRDAASARAKFRPLNKVADGVSFTRDLVSEPPNVLFPESLAKQARGLTELGVKVEVLNETRMARLGMHALLGVAQGSATKPRLVVMRWSGVRGGRRKQPVAFVGKGVTFDTGGISIKPANNMWDMKWDMGGSAVVIGLMKALAGRKARVNAIGVVGLVENMPSGTAQRPGDIVTSMSGQTIEVLNTDAEGRLVLADALWYCQDRFKPQFMVDLATLTGAIIVSLGHVHAGLFSNNDDLAGRLLEAGKAVGERVWRLPLDDDYDRAINSDAADMKNIGDGGAGSITAAQFLQRFVNGVPWAHLDIAGVTWSKKEAPTVPKGGTGFGVRLLDRLVADHYEAA